MATCWIAAGTGKWMPGMEAHHAGPFQMVRHRPGGPPPVRNLEWIYGLPSNSVQQQDEADRGSVFAIRTTQTLGEIIQSQRRRKVPEAATLENPPGSESQTEGSMWALPETADFMERFDCAKAWFNTCAYQQKGAGEMVETCSVLEAG